MSLDPAVAAMLQAFEADASTLNMRRAREMLPVLAEAERSALRLIRDCADNIEAIQRVRAVIMENSHVTARD